VEVETYSVVRVKTKRAVLQSTQTGQVSVELDHMPLMCTWSPGDLRELRDAINKLLLEMGRA